MLDAFPLKELCVLGGEGELFMVFAGGLGWLHGLMEATVLFRESILPGRPTQKAIFLPLYCLRQSANTMFIT